MNPGATPHGRAAHPTLVLIGLRGSGKSTLGRALASRLERPFVDLDDLTAESLQLDSAAAVIREHGLPVFRETEARALADALDHDHRTGHAGVLSLGGGTPTAPGAERLLRQAQAEGRAAIVYLRATPESLTKRLQTEDPDARPSLTGRGTLEEIGELFAQRDRLYTSLADGVLQTDELDPSTVLDDLAAWAADPRR